MMAFCGDLFAVPAIRVQTPIARASDPVTSHLAAKEITASGVRFSQQKKVADAVRRHPGHTSQELAEMTGLERYMLARRLPECVTARTVRKGEPKHCDITKKLALTWHPTGDSLG